MRFSLMLAVFAACTTETTNAASDLGTAGIAGSEHCAQRWATIQSPAVDAVVTGPSVDARVSWNPEPSSEAVQVFDPAGKGYQPASVAVDNDGAHVYHFVLPASTRFDLEVQDQCAVAVGPGKLRTLVIDLGSRQFSTSP